MVEKGEWRKLIDQIGAGAPEVVVLVGGLGLASNA